MVMSSCFRCKISSKRCKDNSRHISNWIVVYQIQEWIGVYLGVSVDVMLLENITRITRPIAIDVRVVLNLVSEVMDKLPWISDIITNIDV